jgi:type IV secretory pathway ATPase VirB11/archaellum biosynthesis ATPase
MFETSPGTRIDSYSSFPFAYTLRQTGNEIYYEVLHTLSREELAVAVQAVPAVSEQLSPASVTPLTFTRLVEVLEETAAAEVAKRGCVERVKEMTELVAYEAIGLSRLLAFARDTKVCEFYVDSLRSPVYLDHVSFGRCQTTIQLNEREVSAIQTHMDTFGGFSADYTMPSLKTEFQVSGCRLRVSLDLEPLSVNQFSLDVRRLNLSTLTMQDLIGLNVLTTEAADFLQESLHSGTNMTIVGEPGTGKTTLLNALDESLDPRLRRIYIEDAVETKDLLGLGYHQLKLRVDPFERTGKSSRTKALETVKILHRSPDLLILGEIQSAEHGRAFFHALSAGVRGMQTFHSSSPEQAMRRWLHIHEIPSENLLDLGIIVQMVRPNKLESARFVLRICRVVERQGTATLEDVFTRDGTFKLCRTGPKAESARGIIVPKEADLKQVALLQGTPEEFTR